MPRPSAWIGIDPSYSAFALMVLVEDKRMPAGFTRLEFMEDFSPPKAGHGPARLSLIHRQLRDLFTACVSEFQLRQVAIEGYAPGAKFHRETLGELGAVVRLAVHDVLHEACGPPLIVAPTAVKKFATGKGTAPKDTVMLAVYKKWGAEFASNDLADAYVLARIARAATEGADLGYEADVIAALAAGDKKQKTVGA